MHGIQVEGSLAARCGDEDDIGESGDFVARFTKSFLFLEAVERASAQATSPLVKSTQRSPGHPPRVQRNGADRRDSCLEEELDYRLQRMTDIARTLRGTCARQRDQIQALCASARRCHDDCVRLFADMTRHFRCRLAAQRKQVVHVGAAMAVVENRNLELNRAFGEMLARATCTIDDLEERLESSRAELGRERDEVEALRRRVAALENANRSARQETALALTRLEESDATASEVQAKLESAEKVSRYYELLLDASLRKLCMYEDPDESERKASSDMIAPKDDHVFATGGVENVIKDEGTKMWPKVGGHSWDGRVRASSVSGLPESTVACSSGEVARKLSQPTYYGHVTADPKNGIGAVSVAKPDVASMTGISMTSLYTTSDLSLPLIGLLRIKGDSESTVTDVASSMTSLLSEPSPVVPKRKTKKRRRRLTRQLRKSFSLEEAEQMEADIASVQTTTTSARSDNTDATVLLNGCQNDVTSGKPTPKEDAAGSRDLAKTEDLSSVLPQKQTAVVGDATESREGDTNDSSTGASRDTAPGHNKPKRTATFKGLKISGNAGFANFVRDVQRKLKRPRRSKTVELADLIGIRRPETDSLNGDCNL